MVKTSEALLRFFDEFKGNKGLLQRIHQHTSSYEFKQTKTHHTYILHAKTEKKPAFWCAIVYWNNSKRYDVFRVKENSVPLAYERYLRSKQRVLHCVANILED